MDWRTKFPLMEMCIATELLVLEMFTAKRPTDDTFTGGLNLRRFVEKAFTAQITDVIDPYLLLPEDGEESDDTRDMISSTRETV